MKKYRFSIRIIEEQEDRCTKVFDGVSNSKLEFIKDYIESLSLYNKSVAAEDQIKDEEIQKALF